MVQVFLDTNVLMHAQSFKINIDDTLMNLIGQNVEISIHPKVESEIISFLLDEGKKGNQASFAMKLMSLFSQYLDDRDYPGADTALLITARREKACVWTLDLDLKKRCLRVGIPVISYFRKGKMKLYGNEYI